MGIRALAAARGVLRSLAVRLVVGACVAFVAAEAHAQPAIRTMTLREAIAYARVHQPSLQAAQARVAVAREQAQLPRAAWDPKVLAGAEALVGTNNNTTASYLSIGWLVPRIGGTPANAAHKWKPEPSTLAGIGVLKEVYDFGRLNAQASALDLFTRAAEEDAQLADLDLTLYVEESFYGVAGARAVLTASEAAVQRATAHRDLARAGVDAKLRPPIELTRAEADLARFEVDRVRAQGAVTSAQAVLAAAIGAPDPAIDAGADDLAYPVFPTLAAAVRDLDAREPSLRAASDVLRGQRAVTESIEAELRPDISFNAGITGRAGGSSVSTNPTPTGAGWIPDVPNWDAMFVLTWPIFDRTINVRAEASRRLERVRAAELDTERERLRGRAAQAYVEMQVAQSALPALERSRDAARANQDQADQRFRSGLASAVELADAEALLTDADIQLAIGRFQLARARARLARVIAEGVK
jgi:outer membrane protein TolC